MHTYFVRKILLKHQRVHTDHLFKHLQILYTGHWGTQNLHLQYETRSTLQLLFVRPKVNNFFFFQKYS